MNREETEEAIEVMQAYLDGRQIKVQSKNGITTHRFSIESGDAYWNFAGNNYEVIPEQKTIWVNEYYHKDDTIHETKDAAEKNYAPVCIRRAVEYMEVLSDE